ncbi:HNH endonuclease [Streptomyces sp. NBC_00503]|uniref:HNH endonuclease n=1 Tax=Streptomyces sp. NBC_00503 TaxID=2903659 RepID=UPI002E803AFE|nr:HNH endonuclease signature motif containing protein [Streptomyces sp. NBC_00503]
MTVRCIDCTEPATHRGRCEAHHKEYEGRASVRARRKRRQLLAGGNDAARRLRRTIRKAGRARCARCLRDVLASAIDIDHVQPLALGGEDVDDNVQTLCRGCHKLKTREDFGAAGPPF